MIPVNRPLIGERERLNLLEAIDTGWISSEGPFVERFEVAMAARVGRRFGIACTSGSAALDMAVAAAGIGPGDEVVMPTLTIISPAASVVRCGGKPVLVDSLPDTWNMDPDAIEAKITPATHAILVVHLYGLPVDMDPIIDIADRHGLMIIEDAAEVHGQTYRGRSCGSFGAMSTFSFYPNKHVTCGEGGMVLTDDESTAEHLRRLRNLCFEPGRRFVHHEIGWNYRMTNLQAALGVAQVDSLDHHIDRKRRMGQCYYDKLHRCEHLQLPVDSTDAAENHYWVYGVVLRPTVGVDAAEVMGRLGQRGIGTRPFFWPMHQQPVFRRMGWYEAESYPVAERLARRGFYLPSGLGSGVEDFRSAAEALLEVIEQCV